MVLALYRVGIHAKVSFRGPEKGAGFSLSPMFGVGQLRFGPFFLPEMDDFPAAVLPSLFHDHDTSSWLDRRFCRPGDSGPKKRISYFHLPCPAYPPAPAYRPDSRNRRISSLFYRYALAAGLIVSLLTDFFLMLQKRRFKMETGGFILAHALYALAILSTERLEILSLPTGILLLYAAVIGFLLIRHRPHSGILSLLYVAVTAICASAAFGMVLRRPEPGRWLRRLEF